MKSENELQERINILIIEMKKLKAQPASDLFTHMENIRESTHKYRELKILYDVIEEPVPENTKSLLVHGWP